MNRIVVVMNDGGSGDGSCSSNAMVDLVSPFSESSADDNCP